MATVQPPITESKGSPFMSLFHRKKKINGTKSHHDLKTSVERAKSPEKASAKETKLKKPHQSSTLPSKSERKKKGRTNNFWGTKSQSLDALFEEDPNVLVEALETIAFEQPMVARSIPKHAKILKREDKSLKNCLFEQEVYDSMLSDSLRVCDLLQSHLDECIVSVRAKSPEPCFLDTSQDGHDSGRGASSASSTVSTSPSIAKKPLKTSIPSDV